MRLRWLGVALALAMASAACDRTDDDGDDVSSGGDGTQAASTPASATPTAQPRDSMTVVGQTPTTGAASTAPGSVATATSAPATSTPVPSTPTTSPGATVTQSTSSSNPLVQSAIADLAARLGVGPGSISVVTHDEVEWNDGALGCPQPGMSYTQALVNGYRVVLSHAGNEYAYHGRTGSPPFYCANPA